MELKPIYFRYPGWNATTTELWETQVKLYKNINLYNVRLIQVCTFVNFVLVAPFVKVFGPIGAAVVGDNVTLNCSIEEGSTAAIQWSKDNLTRSKNERLFRLTKVKAEDEGWYICKAENKAGSSSDRIFLTVDGKCLIQFINLITIHPLLDIF